MAALYVDDIVFDEGDGVVNIVVRLTEAATQAVSVNYATANGTAAGGFDFTGVSGTLNFAIGEISKVVQVQLLNDAVAENLEHFRFNLSAPVNATIAKASAMVSIVDNDTVVTTPGLFVRDVVVDEKAGTASFVVMLGGPKGQASSSTVTVDYATSNATAIAGSDYTAVSGTLTFAVGETVKTVTVNITDDASVEGFERFGLNLSNASGATILDGHADAIIGASDASAVALPRISVSDMVVGEADGYVDIVVSLSAPGQNAVAVNYATANGTAAGGFDATGVSGTLNFALGETTKVVRVELLNDAVVENLEHFTFNLSAAVNATIAVAEAMISIVDNDTVAATPGLFVRDVVVDEKAGTASFVVMLGGPKGQSSNSVVTVDYATGNSTSNATATAGADYTAVSGTLTFASGETVKTVVVDITDDALAEGQERFNLALSNAIGATLLDAQGVALIGSNDAVAVAQPRISVSDMVVGEADGYVDIVVSLSAPGQNAVAVNYATANGTAAGGFDATGVNGTLNFAVGETTKVVRVELLNDAVAENLEHFTFNLSAAVNATIAAAEAMISIVDNDTVVDTPNLFVRDVVVDEKAGTASFVVMLGGPKGQSSNSVVTVDYVTGNSTSNATATAGADYTAVSGTLTFASGETVKTVVVDITDDALAEGQERFNLTLSNAIGATLLDAQGVALIGSNDAVAVAQPRISVSDMVVGEADGYVDIVVSLSAPGQNAVSVNYATANGTAAGGFDATGVNGTLNFAVGETTKVVRVELLNDAVAENLEHFTFNLSAAVNATIAAAEAMISIVDNDTVVDTPNLFVRDVVVDEKAGTASFVVMLGGPKGQSSNSVVTVDYATANSASNAAATAGADYTAVSGTLTFASGETVKTVVVDITDDALAEGQERFNLNLSNAIGATILDGRGVAVIGANDGSLVTQPRISVADIVVGEADGYVDIVVSLSNPGQNAVSVNYATANGTAAGGFDATGVNGTLNFAVGETTKVVRVELLNDAVAENLEHFTFNLSAAVNATIAAAEAMISIVDNDTVVDTPNLFVRDVVVDENAGTASFVVMLGGPKGQSSNSVVTVDYATANSASNAAATAGADYTAVSGTLTFASGETVKTVVVDITPDTFPEGDERFNLTLSNAIGATLLDAQGVAVIGVNDAVAVAQPRISVSDMVVGEADGYVDIVVSLSAPGQNAVAVNYATANGTAAGGFDATGVNGTLNFAVGETTKVVRVELLNDAVAENLEHFTFNLSAPTNATIAKAQAMVSIVDNDTVVDTPNLFVRDVVVDEKAGTASFVVMLGGPKGQSSNSVVTVNYATSNATALAGSDYTAVSGTLTFASGETVKTVVVDITDDALAEGQERFNFALSNAIGAAIADGRGAAVIGANDAAAVATPVISVADIVVAESDGYVDIVVNLGVPGQSAVSVNYATANGTAAGGFDLTGVSGTLNFAVGETTKVVRVELIDNTAVEALETFRFNLSGAVNATLANTFATISIVDNDTAGINVYSYIISDDIYNVSATTDVIVENPGGGYDLVNASANYTLPDQVEALVLVEGAGPLTGTGNGLANSLSGNSQNNILNGAFGDDTLDGGAGADQLHGGDGNDTYNVDTQADIVFENPGEGTDTVITSTSFYLYDHIENLTLAAGAGNIFGSANASNNTLTGNEGGNLLIGWDGNDTILGGAGNDVIYGVNNDDSLFGEAGIDVLVAGEGNDTLDGGADPDELYGENGNDVLYGGSGFVTDILVGGAGNDTLDGSASVASGQPRNQGDFDYLYGQLGDDTYYVDTPADLTFEFNGTGEGIDTVIADITGAGYYLYDSTENLILTGNTAFGVGNGQNNVITGSVLGTFLLGGGGNDTLNGKQGNDVLFGEAGADTFVFERGTNGDVIGDFTPGVDKIQLIGIGYNSFAQVQPHLVQNGGTTAIDLGAGDLVVLNGVAIASLSAGDFLFA